MRNGRLLAWCTLGGSAIVGLGAAATAWAAAGDAYPRPGPVLFGLAVLVVAAKLGGLVAERWGQPSVLGELLVGIGLGNLLPPLFGSTGIAFVRSDPALATLAEMGVLILLFDVGLEADLRALARVGPSSALVAAIGVVVPFGLGWASAAWLLPQSPPLVHVFIGATLTATSVGITVRLLKDLGATQSLEGHIVLGAALLDDVLGLMILAIVGGMITAAAGGTALSGWAIAAILLKAVLFLAASAGLGRVLSGPIVRGVGRTGQPGILLVVGLALCFALAYVAELVGLAAIVGAFAAGILLDPYGQGVRTRAEEATLSELLRPLSSLFVPLFFVVMGIQVHLGSLADPSALGLSFLLVACAIAGKLACGLGVVQPNVSRLVVGVAMIPRGEVGLIFAGIGASLTLHGQPILAQSAFSAIVVMVVITTLVTPIGLQWAFSRTTRRAKGTPR